MSQRNEPSVGVLLGKCIGKSLPNRSWRYLWAGPPFYNFSGNVRYGLRREGDLDIMRQRDRLSSLF